MARYETLEQELERYYEQHLSDTGLVCFFCVFLPPRTFGGSGGQARYAEHVTPRYVGRFRNLDYLEHAAWSNFALQLSEVVRRDPTLFVAMAGNRHAEQRGVAIHARSLSVCVVEYQASELSILISVLALCFMDEEQERMEENDRALKRAFAVEECWGPGSVRCVQLQDIESSLSPKVCRNAYATKSGGYSVARRTCAAQIA